VLRQDRVVWLRAHADSSQDIDEPRIYFSTSRRSQSAYDASAVRSDGRRTDSNLPRCQSLPLNLRHAVGVQRRIALTTKRSVIKMSISVTVGYLACWTPFIVMKFIRIYSEYKLTTATSVSLLMALSHSAVNPFLYIVFSTRAVRASFVKLCRRAVPRCRQRGRRGSGQEMFGVQEQRRVAARDAR